MYAERRRSEDMLINDMTRKYGANVSLFIGVRKHKECS